jgi:hypothetical protein
VFLQGPFTNSAFYQLVKQFHGSQYLLESVVQAIDTQVAKCRREEQNIWEEEKHTKEFAPKGFVEGCLELRDPIFFILKKTISDGYAFHEIGAEMVWSCVQSDLPGKQRD